MRRKASVVIVATVLLLPILVRSKSSKGAALSDDDVVQRDPYVDDVMYRLTNERLQRQVRLSLPHMWVDTDHFLW